MNLNKIEPLGKNSALLKGFAFEHGDQCLVLINDIAKRAPFRFMKTPRGQQMSVAMTNCGRFGWVADRSGYRYLATDPITNQAWPSMPPLFYDLAVLAAEQVGFDHFQPDACLVNRYQVKAKMGMHQDKDEVEFDSPIVSLSFGLPVIFKFGGVKRTDTVLKFELAHGDALVFGGAERLVYHGVLPLKSGFHPLTSEYRYNLTFRKAR